MTEDALRRILLVKAVEEEDAGGVILPLADRGDAARSAARAGGGIERLLAARAAILVPRLVARHPFLDRMLGLLRRVTWLHATAILLGAVAGVAFSALDGSRYVNLLSLPLQGLLLWNVVVVILAIALALRRGTRPRMPLREGIGWAVERFGAWLARSPLTQAARFDAPLARALRRCLPGFAEAARPRLAASAGAALHLGAAAVGLGFIAGLLVRGLVLEYRAGWESTFLEPAQARAWLQVLYGPASALLATPLPDVAHIAQLRWQSGTGGENAASWLARMAVTVALFIVLPRLILAAFSLARAARLRRAVPMPAELEAYARTAFPEAEAAIPARKVLLAPYAYAPSYDAMETLRARLREALGGKAEIRALEPVPYGEEERLRSTFAALREPGDLLVIALTLASTPEAENHGRVVSAARERGDVELLLDEAEFARRMATAPERVAERRAAWERFAAEHGVPVRMTRSDP